MLPVLSPLSTEAWSQLEKLVATARTTHMREQFKADPHRYNKFSRQMNGLLFDFSKHRIDDEVFNSLIALAEECRVPEAIHDMFSGAAINVTENRPVLHVALRAMQDEVYMADGENVVPEVYAVLDQLGAFSDKVRNKEITGYTGKAFTDVVNIGIGGSDLGPVMVSEALKAFSQRDIQLHFVSNVDGTHMAECLRKLDPETTLFIIASKTFTTQETMTNAQSARTWFLEHALEEKWIAAHFVAVSTALDHVEAFGISPERTFGFWPWVGGRYSLWSAIGLSIMIGIGKENFRKLLDGAHAADVHFKETELKDNIPVIMALLGIWYTNFFHTSTHAVLPYNQYLSSFPAYLQQADMESNGKHVDRTGKKVGYATGPVVWGESGTNGQHAFYQLIHQGTQMIPCDFILPVVSQNEMGKHHPILISHCLAQSEALMRGKTLEEVRQELLAAGMPEEEVEWQAPYRVFEGNIPSSTFILPEINPFQLGQLIALYEHKIFVQGVIWNIFSFDQWGVELGKKLAAAILPELATNVDTLNHDASTNNLIQYIRNARAASLKK